VQWLEEQGKKISIRSLKRQCQAWVVRTRNQLDSEILQAIGEEIKALYTKTLDSDEAIAEQLSAVGYTVSANQVEEHRRLMAGFITVGKKS
jgi:hypothetical protein